MNCGIVGLPNVGKTALFNLITSNSAPSSNYPYCTVEPNNGVAIVEDSRIIRLSSLFPGAKLAFPNIKFIDVAGLPPGASQGEGLGNQFLGNIRNADVIMHVVRAFTAPEVVKIDQSDSDPSSDFALVMTELFLSDLQIAARRVKENPMDKYWKTALQSLESERIPQPDPEGVLLTPKPQITVVNMTSGSVKPDIRAERIIYIDVTFQQEIEGMGEADREMFIAEMPDWESSAYSLIEDVKKLMGLVTFFTIVGGNEIKGYNIPAETTAYEAAGMIHTQIQKGFIRAKVFNYKELEEEEFDIESLKKKGRIRTEGRDYNVKEGDILEILFS